MTQPVIDILVQGDFAADVAETFAETLSSEFNARTSAKAVQNGAIITLQCDVVATMDAAQLQEFLGSIQASEAAYQINAFIRMPDGTKVKLSDTSAQDIISVASSAS